MKMPRGFGKNYFSLNAITATVNGVSLQKESSRVHTFYLHSSPYSYEDETIEELEEMEAAPWVQQLQNSKVCHCSCVFFRKTRKILIRLRQAKKLPDIYESLKSNLSPPERTLINY